MTNSPFDANPFDSTSPWNEQPQAAQQPAANPRPEAPMSDGNKVRVTLKGGKGYDAPWITIDGTSVEDALAQLQKGPVKDLVDLTAKVGSYFANSGNGAPAAAPQAAPATPPQFVNGQVVQGGQPLHQPAPQPASGTACAHGERVLREGNGAKGPWAGLMCPTPKGTPGQCAPLWKQKDGTFK
jgi:hypothetical protein